MESWRVVNWLPVERAGNKRAESRALRARQLERRPQDIEKAAEAQQTSREANPEHFNKHRCHRPEGENHQLRNGDLLLLHNTKLESSHSHKLSNRLSGPYRTADAMKKGDRGTYRLAELDGTILEGYFSWDRVKRFITRERFFMLIEGGFPLITKLFCCLFLCHQGFLRRGCASAEVPGMVQLVIVVLWEPTL